MISRERLRHLVSYSAETGIFRWRRCVSNVKKGQVLGSRKDNGYLYAFIDKRRYYLHRLAFLYMTGALPPADVQVDHRDRVRDNNAWGNLRQSDQAHNNTNTASRTKSGFKGVDRRGRRWRASITVDKKHIHIGYFGSDIEAAKRRDEEAVKHYGEFAELNFPVDHQPAPREVAPQ